MYTFFITSIQRDKNGKCSHKRANVQTKYIIAMIIIFIKKSNKT